MHIALIAENNKKELMAQFSIAYCGIMSKHNLYASYLTGKYIADATGLEIETFLAGGGGGIDQIASKVAYNEIDLVFYFRSTEVEREPREDEVNLMRLCDENNIPIATNLATAEILILALENGDLNWREFVNPSSEYNKRKNGKI